MDGIGWRKIAGLRQPTVQERDAIWALCEAERKGNNKATIFALVALIVFVVFSLCTSDVMSRAWILMFLAVLVVGIGIALFLTAKVNGGVKNIHAGKFWVADVLADDFTESSDTDIPHGFAYVTDMSGQKCKDRIGTNLDIVKKYRGQSRVPMLYVYEKTSSFRWIYAPEELEAAIK